MGAKNKRIIVLSLLLTSILCFISCCKENDDQTHTSSDELSEKTFLWETDLPYVTGSGISSKWLDDINHTPSQFDSLSHKMEIRFIGNFEVAINEQVFVWYSSAYRYIGPADTDDVARVFMVYPQYWQKYDSNYCVTDSKMVSAHYDGNYPNVEFRLKDVYIHNGSYIGSSPNYNYMFVPWDSDEQYLCKFVSIDTCVFSFTTTWNTTHHDTIDRVFVYDRK